MIAFLKANPRAQEGHEWRHNDITALLEALSRLEKGEEATHRNGSQKYLHTTTCCLYVLQRHYRIAEASP